MKINIITGFFLPVPPVSGGATEKIWFKLSQLLAQAGHEVTFLSRQWPTLPPEETIGGVRHVRLAGANHTASLPRNLWRDFRWGLRVGKKLPAADVTICNTVFLPVWLRRRHPRAGRVVAVIARMPKGQGRLYGGVDLLLSLSGTVTDALCRENAALARRIAPFPFPIDWRLHASAAEARGTSAEDPLTIGYIGRIHPEKGLDVLLAAAARLAQQRGLPAWRLRVVGPISVPAGGGGEAYQQHLQATHGAALAGRLHFLGPIYDPVQLATMYAENDVFCYPSLAEAGETFGVAVAEAMAARCASIVSRLNCFAELIRDGQTGLVFDHRQDPVTGLTSALARYLTQPDFRRAMAGRAQAHAAQFDFNAIALRVERYLQFITGEPGGRRFDRDEFAVESSQR